MGKQRLEAAKNAYIDLCRESWSSSFPSLHKDEKERAWLKSPAPTILWFSPLPSNKVGKELTFRCILTFIHTNVLPPFAVLNLLTYHCGRKDFPSVKGNLHSEPVDWWLILDLGTEEIHKNDFSLEFKLYLGRNSSTTLI